MKYIITLLFFAAFGCKTAPKADQMSTIPFFTPQQKQMLDSTHKAGDVDVFCLTDKDTMYYLRMYHNEDGEIRRYETTIQGKAGYDRVSYQWLNDSTVLFHLLNSRNNNVQQVKLSGSGAVTSVE